MAPANNGDARHQPVAGRVVVVIPTLDEAQSIAAVVRSIPRPLVGRIIVADGGSRDATVLRAQEAGAEVIAAGRGYGRACLAATMAADDADIVVFMDGDGADDPQDIARLLRADPLRPLRFRHRIARTRQTRAWKHCLAPARGWHAGRLGDAAPLRRALHRHVRVPGHPSRRAAGAWNARAHLRLEYRNANARGAGGTAHSGNSSRLSPAQRRHFKGCGKLVGYRAGWRAHHRDVRSRFASNQAASVVGRTQASAPAFKRSVIKWASPQRDLSHDAITRMVYGGARASGPIIAHPSWQ